MDIIRVHLQIDSETLHLPELKPLVGKTVEIVIREEASPPVKRDWQPLIDAAADDLVEPDVYRHYREFDRQQNASAPQ